MSCNPAAGQIDVVTGGQFTGFPTCFQDSASALAAAGLGDAQSIDPDIQQPTVIRANLGMQARFDLGPTTERQQLTQQLDRGRAGYFAGTAKLPEAMWKAQYTRGPVLNPIDQVLRSADTLQLTRNQADSIAALNRWYTVRLDSIWTPIAREFAGLPANSSQDAA